MKSSLYIYIIIIIVSIVFFKVVSFSYLKYDDTINIFENELIIFPSAGNVIFFWEKPFLHLYIPVVYTAWSVIAWFSVQLFNNRLDPGLFHLFNLLVHIINSVLVYLLILRILSIKNKIKNFPDAKFPAFIGAMIFSIHPVQVEAVSWITGFKDILSCFYVLVAISLYFVFLFNSKTEIKTNQEDERHPRRGVSTPSSRLYGGSSHNMVIYFFSSFFFLLSVLSKPSSVAAPLVILIILLWIDKRIIIKAFYYLLPWFFMVLMIVLITKSVQQTSHFNFDYPLFIRPFVAVDALMFYLYKILWPNILLLDYCRTPVFVLSLSWANPFWFIFIGLLIYFCKNKKNWLVLYAAFITALLPVSGLIPFSYQQISTVADRYLYFAMVPLAVIISVSINKKKSAKIVLICLIIVSILGVKSFYQCQLWENTGSIMRHTLNYYPQSYTANLNYGISLLSKGKFSKAAIYCKNASTLQPNNPLSYYNLGIAYAGMGKNKLYKEQYDSLMNKDSVKAVRLKRAANILFKLKAEKPQTDVLQN